MTITKMHIDFRIEPPTEADVPAILRLIKGLAEYERMADEVVATEQRLRDTLFGPRRFAEVVIGYAGTEPVGFAVFFHSYSTFLAAPGLYLEDIFVEPGRRGRGLGRQLLEYVARAAVVRGCGRLEWSVLDWNEPAIGFYTRLGAHPMDGWTVYRMTGDALAALAGGS
ncbi:MAG: GNAT family N-acetyltransferase [Vicinamibacterales bacterium]